MRDNEIKALGTLAGQAIARPAVIAKGVHTAAAGRAFRALGALGAPVRVMHDAIAGAAYRSINSALRSPVAAGAAALALELSVRQGGRDVELDAAGLAAAFPDATPRLALFVHGLCETEDAWHILPAVRDAPRRSYGARLRDDLGYTPVYVRYNTGLHVSDNGRRLAAVIERLAAGWPVHVDEISIVGHSMGGLVARSACHYAAADEQRWVEHLQHVFCLGTPQLGAPLEKAANGAGWALGRLAEARPSADLVNTRSAGIKDLRFGNCVEEDWCDCEPDEFLRDRCREAPFVPTATYYFVGATLARDKDSQFASIVGDLLVQFPSASGQGRKRSVPFEIENGRHLGGINHFQLLNHPAVYEHMRAWLEQEAPATVRVGT